MVLQQEQNQQLTLGSVDTVGRRYLAITKSFD